MFSSGTMHHKKKDKKRVHCMEFMEDVEFNTNLIPMKFYKNLIPMEFNTNIYKKIKEHPQFYKP